MMFCSNCGTQLPDGAKFCIHCGSQIQSNAVPKNPAPQQTAPAPPRVDPPKPAPQPQAQPRPQQPVNNPVPPQQPMRSPVPPQQPMYQQPMYQQPMYQQPAYGGAPPKAKKKGSPLVPILIVVIVLGLIAAIVTPLVLFKAFKKSRGGADTPFGKLCDTTQLGVRSYSYARMLTEQLLETDLATADPEKMDQLFEECLSAWDAVGQVSDSMGSLSAQVAEHPSDKSRSASTVLTAIAADGTNSLAVTLNESESAERCQVLSSQMRADADSCADHVRQLRAIYNGRSTSLSDWDEMTGRTSLCFKTVVFFAGEITDGDGTVVSENGPRSIRTLSTREKNQPLTVDGADVVVDVNPLGSVFVIGGSNTVNMNYEELEPYLSSNSTAISVSNNTASVTSEGSRSTRHRCPPGSSSAVRAPSPSPAATSMNLPRRIRPSSLRATPVQPAMSLRAAPSAVCSRRAVPPIRSIR